MKENNELISFINSSVSFTPNYNDIKFRINDLEFNKNNKKLLNFMKLFKLAIYTVVICLASVLTTIIVKSNMYGQSNDVSPGKESIKFLEENFDEFFAFGSGSPSSMFTIDIIMNSSLIGETAKDELMKYKNEYNKERNYQYFNVYLGNKSGKDIVLLYPLGEPNIIFEFESNLSYLYEDVISQFEVLIGRKLTKEFIYGSSFDNVLRKETMGIILSFKNVEDIYSPYFTIELDNKIYVVDK